jgi:ABC-type nickel/cobalt efflux system permease component RcnA
MEQMCTGDGWASGVARDLFDQDGTVAPLPALFFGSYMLVAGVVLINIVVAVLLDEFLTTMAKTRQAFEQEDAIRTNPIFDDRNLDPLMEVLAKYRSGPDLYDAIDKIFQRLDLDCSGGVGYSEMRDGLPRMVKGLHFSTEHAHTHAHTHTHEHARARATTHTPVHSHRSLLLDGRLV